MKGNPFHFYWHPFEESNQMRPQAREGGTIITLGSQIVLFGGASKALMNDIWFFDTSNFQNS